MKDNLEHTVNSGKFEDSHLTAKGEARARVALSDPETLWFNTGTLCNIECVNCYIESSPRNDRLAYIKKDEVADFLGQLEERNWGVREIGFTGGEPFMNPQMIEILEISLTAGYDVLVLTNAMRPMMRPKMQHGLSRLNKEHPGKLTLRVSLDHWSQKLHDDERGSGSYQATLEGMRWIRDMRIKMTVAGRSAWHESDASAREGYAKLYCENDFHIDPQDPGETVLFPEMDLSVEVPEITTACWDLLDKDPKDVMCSSSRMVVKRKGAARPAVVACTLLPYSPEFELGETLAEAEGDVALNHPHCAKFCVLGGASCSG